MKVYKFYTQYFQEMLSYRYAIYQFFKQGLIVMYAQSLLWLSWLFVLPILGMLVFVYLRKMEVLNVSNDDITLPYPLFIFYGGIFWQFFSSTIRDTCFISNNHKANKTLHFPKETAIYGKALLNLFNVLISLVFLLCFAAIYKVPNDKIFILPFILIGILLFALGLSKIFAIGGVITRDIIEGMPIIMIIWLLLTPSIYTKVTYLDSMSFILIVNPLNSFIHAARLVFSHSGESIPTLFYIHFLCAVGVYLIGTYLFRKAQPLIMDRI